MSEGAKKIVTLNTLAPYNTFLPSQGDVTVLCTDSNANGAQQGFLLSRSALSKRSPFFDDMFSLDKSAPDSNGANNEPLRVQEHSAIVGLVLSALFERPKTMLSTASRIYLEQARRLACKWQFEEARPPILFAIFSKLPSENPMTIDLTLLAEALYQGQGASDLLDHLIKESSLRYNSYSPKRIELSPMTLQGHMLTDFGGPDVPLLAMTKAIKLVSQSTAHSFGRLVVKGAHLITSNKVRPSSHPRHNNLAQAPNHIRSFDSGAC